MFIVKVLYVTLRIRCRIYFCHQSTVKVLQKDEKRHTEYTTDDTRVNVCDSLGKKCGSEYTAETRVVYGK